MFKHRIYHTIAYNDSTVYFEGESSTDSTKVIKKVFDSSSPYFDVLICIQKLLDYIEGNSLEHHQLIKEGALTLFVENKVLSAKLKSLEDSIATNYKGKKIRVKKLSIYGCPDDKTHIDLFIDKNKVIKVHGRFDNFFGVRLNAELKEP